MRYLVGILKSCGYGGRGKLLKGFALGPSAPMIVNPIPTGLCQVTYCHGDKSYPCLVGIGLINLTRQTRWLCNSFEILNRPVFSRIPPLFALLIKFPSESWDHCVFILLHFTIVFFLTFLVWILLAEQTAIEFFFDLSRNSTHKNSHLHLLHFEKIAYLVTTWC